MTDDMVVPHTQLEKMLDAGFPREMIVSQPDAS